jgi:hypothetical protein
MVLNNLNIDKTIEHSKKYSNVLLIHLPIIIFELKIRNLEYSMHSYNNSYNTIIHILHNKDFYICNSLIIASRSLTYTILI